MYVENLMKRQVKARVRFCAIQLYSDSVAALCRFMFTSQHLPMDSPQSGDIHWQVGEHAGCSIWVFLTLL